MRHPQAVPRPAGDRRPASTLALAGILALLLTAFAGPAAAHDVLLGSDPEDGAVLTVAPEQVVLTFSAPQAEIGTQVEVTADGDTWADGPALVDGTTVSQPLRAGMPAGVYTIQWRSVASDGHPVDGELTFTLDLPAEPEPEADPGPEPDPDSEPVEIPAPTATISAGDPTVETTDADPAPWLIAGGFVLLIGVVIAAVARRRNAEPEPQTGIEVADE